MPQRTRTKVVLHFSLQFQHWSTAVSWLWPNSNYHSDSFDWNSIGALRKYRRHRNVINGQERKKINENNQSPINSLRFALRSLMLALFVFHFSELFSGNWPRFGRFSKRIITLVLREWRSYRKDTQLLETCAIFPDQSLHTSLFRKHFLMCALRPARAIKNNKQTKKLTQRKSDGNNVTIGDSPSRRFKAGKQHTPSGLFMRSLSICANRWRQENF